MLACMSRIMRYISQVGKGGYDKTIHEIRKFNRFYTVSMGFLDSAQIETKINQLSIVECNKLCDAMETIISILGKGE